MIIRVDHKKNYTVISDAALRDERLSFRATGVLAYLLSLPDGAELSGVRLVNAKAEGRDAVYTALKELDDAGYLLRDRRQDDTGRWYTVCTVRELPPGNPQPITGFQKSVTRQSVTQELKNRVPDWSTRKASLETETAAPMPEELRRRIRKDEPQEQTA